MGLPLSLLSEQPGVEILIARIVPTHVHQLRAGGCVLEQVQGGRAAGFVIVEVEPHLREARLVQGAGRVATGSWSCRNRP